MHCLQHPSLVCVCVDWGGGMVGLSRSLRLQPTDQTRIWEEGSGGGWGGWMQLALNSQVDRLYTNM